MRICSTSSPPSSNRGSGVRRWPCANPARHAVESPDKESGGAGRDRSRSPVLTTKHSGWRSISSFAPRAPDASGAKMPPVRSQLAPRRARRSAHARATADSTLTIFDVILVTAAAGIERYRVLLAAVWANDGPGGVGRSVAEAESHRRGRRSRSSDRSIRHVTKRVHGGHRSVSSFRVIT